MTTILALLSREFIVLGSDSLGTYTHDVIPLNDLANNLPEIQDPDCDVLESLNSLKITQPMAHMTQVEKIFHLETGTQSFGVMITGLLDIGDRSVQSLVTEFGDTKLRQLMASNWSLGFIGEQLHSFLRPLYEEDSLRGPLILVLCGFQPSTDLKPSQPATSHISVHTKRMEGPVKNFLRPNIYWEGTYREIDRLVQGVEDELKDNLEQAIYDSQRMLVDQINDVIMGNAPKHGQGSRPKPIDPTNLVFPLFLEDLEGYEPNQMHIDFAGMSIQKAIDFVDFLITVQIKADEFSQRLPTVGGEVQLALIRRERFEWISKREWRHGQNVVPRND